MIGSTQKGVVVESCHGGQEAEREGRSQKRDEPFQATSPVTTSNETVLPNSKSGRVPQDPVTSPNLHLWTGVFGGPFQAKTTAWPVSVSIPVPYCSSPKHAAVWKDGKWWVIVDIPSALPAGEMYNAGWRLLSLTMFQGNSGTGQNSGKGQFANKLKGSSPVAGS